MMRRHWAWRASAVIFAIWFGLVGLEPGALSACPAHGLNAQVAMASHHGHAGHSMAGMERAAPAHQDSAPSSHHHQCTCPDCGCCSALVSAPVASTIPVPSAVLDAVREVAYVSVRPAWVDYALPFSTAPPQDLSV